MLPLDNTACPQLNKTESSEKLEAHRPGDRVLDCPDCLFYVNTCLTILRPHTGQSKEENQQVVYQNAHYLVRNTTIEEHYLWMRRAEALAASVGLLYSERLRKEKIPNPKGAESSADFAAAIQQQKDAQRPKKERRLLTDREKAIESFVKIGISEIDAVKMVDAQMSKEGRAVNPIN